jgi:Ca2+-binding RTX toxin-like protein
MKRFLSYLRGRKRSSVSARLSLEPLDSRVLPSVTLRGRDLHIVGTGESDKVVIDKINNDFKVTENGKVYRFRQTAVTGTIYFSGFGGNDTLNAYHIPRRVVADGGSGNDLIKGGNLDDSLNGGGDSDFIEGGGGSDRIDGGAGIDYLNGGSGNDTLYGGAGNDQLLGGDGVDWLYGGSDKNYLFGGAGDDMIFDGRYNHHIPKAP